MSITVETPPKPGSDLVDLLGEFSSEKLKEIATEGIKHYRLDIDSRSEWEEKRDDWYKLWTCQRDVKNDPWVNCSNVCLPMLATAANQFHARSYQAQFSAPGMVKTIPVGSNDVKKAMNVERFLNWQILYDMDEYEDVADRMLLLLPVNGIAFKKLYYDQMTKRPKTDYISPLDLVLPYRTKSMEEARRITHRIWLHYDEIEKRVERDIYNKTAFKRINETASKETEADLEETADKIAGEEEVDIEDRPHLILEVHRDYKDNTGKSQPYIFTIDKESETVLRVSKRIIKNGAKETTINHFTDYHFIPNPMGFYSFGFGHFLENLNEMANTAFNQIFDSGSMSNKPFGFYGRKAGFKERTIKIKPGKMYEVNDASQVFFPNMQRVDQILFQILGTIQQYSDRFTSTSDYLSGRENKGTKTPTAHGTLAIIEQGLITFGVIAKRVFRSLRKELRLLMLLNNLHMDDKVEYRVMGSEGDIAFPDIKKEDFEGVYDIIPVGDPTFASSQMRRQEAMERYQIIMENPLVAGGPEGNPPPNVEVMHAALKDVLDTYTNQDNSKLLPKLPEPKRLPEEENAMMYQGDIVEPQTGEDHRHHIDTHRRFMEGPYYASMKYKDLLQAHINKTIQISIVDDQQLKGLGGAGVP